MSFRFRGQDLGLRSGFGAKGKNLIKIRDQGLDSGVC